MFRSEYKYYIHNSIVDELRRDILPYLDYDSYLHPDKKKEYTVRSVYLDSPSMKCYHEKLAGVEQRAKFRIRTYDIPDENSRCFVEIKRKRGDYIAKDRVPVLIKNLDSFLTRQDFSLIDSPTGNKEQYEQGARNFFYYFLSCNLKPVAVINYDREPFECKFGTGLRITFDKNIRAFPASSFSELYVEQDMLFPVPEVFVFEVKFYNSLPLWLPDILRKYDVYRTSASKYTLSVDSISERYYHFGLNYV